MKSILYRNDNLTIKDDERLISHLVSNFVASGKNKTFNKRCVEKIIKNIQTKEWRGKYKSVHFVHVFDIYIREDIGDIKFMWMCQILEILYFFEIYSKSDIQYGNIKKIGDIHFYEKLEGLFYHLYKIKINKDICMILKMLRNSVAHTGTLETIKEALGNEDSKSLEKAQKNKIDLRVLAISFNYLMTDIFMRCLGLSDDEMLGNGNPPQHLKIFRYNIQ